MPPKRFLYIALFRNETEIYLDWIDNEGRFSRTSTTRRSKKGKRNWRGKCEAFALHPLGLIHNNVTVSYQQAGTVYQKAGTQLIKNFHINSITELFTHYFHCWQSWKLGTNDAIWLATLLATGYSSEASNAQGWVFRKNNALSTTLQNNF